MRPCSFCGASLSEVAIVLSSGDSMICDRCVDTAAEIVAKKRKGTGVPSGIDGRALDFELAAQIGEVNLRRWRFAPLAPEPARRTFAVAAWDQVPSLGDWLRQESGVDELRAGEHVFIPASPEAVDQLLLALRNAGGKP